MKKRTKILFKIKDEVVVEHLGTLFLNQIDEYKWMIASECECPFDDIDVETVDESINLSEIDVNADGMFDWTDVENKILKGVKCSLVVGSDAYLDAIIKGELDEYLIFI